MSEPVEDVLRQSMAAHAGAREPGLSLAVILTRARRRRRAALAASAAVVTCVAVVGVSAWSGSWFGTSSRPESLGETAADSVLDPQRLASRIAAVVGPGASLVGQPAGQGPGIVSAAEGGPALAGRSRLGAAACTFILHRPDGTVWTLLVGAQSLQPTPPEAAVRELVASRGESPAQPPLQTQRTRDNGVLWVFPATQGVVAVAAFTDGTIATVDVSTGLKQPPRPAMTTLSIQVLHALTQN